MRQELKADQDQIIANLRQEMQQLKARTAVAEAKHDTLVKVLNTGVPTDKIYLAVQLFAGTAEDKELQQKFNQWNEVRDDVKLLTAFLVAP